MKTEVKHFHSVETAVWAAIRESNDGDEVAVHDAKCKSSTVSDDCNCSPLVLVVHRE